MFQTRQTHTPLAETRHIHQQIIFFSFGWAKWSYWHDVWYLGLKQGHGSRSDPAVFQHFEIFLFVEFVTLRVFWGDGVKKGGIQNAVKRKALNRNRRFATVPCQFWGKHSDLLTFFCFVVILCTVVQSHAIHCPHFVGTYHCPVSCHTCVQVQGTLSSPHPTHPRQVA